MAKKTTTKRSSVKKSTKPAKSKPAGVKKKTAVKKAAVPVKKSARKVVVKKAPPKKATVGVKKVKQTIKITKPKSTVEIKEKKSNMPRKKDVKKVQEKKLSANELADRQAEERAKAMQKIKGYSKKDLEHFKQIILGKRDEIIEQLQNLKEQMLDPTTGEYINENSPYSLHMAEQGTDAMEREKTFLYAQRENKFLGYLEDALKRIEAGTYGICIECIEEPQHLCETCPLIPKARLEAVPHSQLCVAIKQKQEKR